MSVDRLSWNIWLSGGERLEEYEYWMSKLKGQWIMGGVAYCYSTFEASCERYGSLKYTFKKDLAGRMNSVTRGSAYGKYMILLSGVFFLLHKYSNNNDLVIGMPIFKQTAKAEYANSLLAIRSQISFSQTYKEYLSEIRKTVEEADNNQNIPFDLLMDHLGITNGENVTSPFKTLVMSDGIHDNGRIDSIHFPLKIVFSAQEDSLEVNVEYDTCLYKKETISDFLLRLEAFYSFILKNSDVQISEISLLNEEEKRKVLYEFNNTEPVFYEDKTLQELFEEQVEKTPDNIAVVYKDKSLTYRELNTRANQLARLLRTKGVGPGSIIGILAERSFEMIVGILGILKAGGAYLPIDPAYPKDRIEYMLLDSNASILLSTEKVPDNSNFEGTIINLYDEDIYLGNIENPRKVNIPEDLAYIIYTSGTTGKPKGVMIEQKAICCTIQWRRIEYALDSSDTVLQLFSFSFDGFLTSFFTPIASGSRVILLGENESKDPVAIGELIVNEGITHFISVPSLYSAILECKDSKDFSSLRIVTLAGEKASDGLIRKSKKANRNLELVNEYGPTENAVVTTVLRNMDETINSVIGKPIPGTKLYILNNGKELIPTGIYGEMCISGNRLAKGYLNKPEMSAEKFIDNPFVPGQRMYRTGDIARWLSDGRVEFLGRIDNQVKIRGYRIETGEIEAQLNRYEKIRESIVIAREDKEGGKYLSAYYIGEEEITQHELREFLLKSLPEYMIPSYFIKLKQLPLNSNGKVDREALPEPEGKVRTLYRAPSNATEEKLVEMWCSILGMEKIGVDDNFFELGGHSLKAMVMVSRIRKETGSDLSLKQLFKNPTVRELAMAVKNTSKSIYDSIEPSEEKEYYPVSSAQKRMYLLNQFEKGTGYNMPAVTLIEGVFDKERFRYIFNYLIDRHESLRTTFEMVEGTIVQRIYKNIEFKMDYYEVSELEVKSIISSIIKPFELDKAPLVRVGLVKLSEAKHILICDMHHIISDGVSVNILIQEFMNLYSGESLPELRLRYKDFALWQNKLFTKETLKKQEEYWIKVFEGEIPVLNLPTDFARPAIQSFEGDTLTFGLEKDLAEGIQKLAAMTGTTVYMLLLAVYNVLLAKYSGQEDIIIGSPSAGRPHADLENIIGMFVNTLTMRNFPEGSKSFKEFLKEVKENALNAYENQDYQFEDILDKLDIKRDASRNPLFDVMFSIQNEEYYGMEKSGLSFKPYPFDYKISKFDMTLNAYISGEQINFTIEYCTRLFSRETIERMAVHLKNTIRAIIKEPEIILNDIDILDEEEKRKLLFDFNNTKTNYPKDRTIHELFDEQVRKNPDKIAIVFEDYEMTYAELNSKAEMLACRLKEKGVKEDTIVGIMTGKSTEMVVGTLGILKAGGAYLPIDPDYPEDRIIYMLEDCNANILMVSNNREKVRYIEDKGLEVLEISHMEECGDNKVYNTACSGANSLAYVMYTSGSTGRPKGVAVEHRNVIRLVRNTNYIEFRNDDRILQTGATVFDATTFELWGALLNGLTLYLTREENILSAEKLGSELEKHRITVLWLTSPLFNQLALQNAEIFKGLRYLLVGGDRLSLKHINKVREVCKDTKIINGYGPTENTTFSVCCHIDREYENDIPIGRPISNSYAFIMDQNNNLKPVSVYGELCVGGDGLARGYVKRPELTAEKFVDNPFKPGEKMYRTGDIARWLPDGTIEFLGRIDNQVKIRGYRIEPGEIDNQLKRNKKIKESVVIVKENKECEKYLLAYYVGEGEITAKEIREFLLKSLPEYMIPSYFIQLDKLPLNHNGKVDRKYLPEPEGKINSGVLYKAPESEYEKILADIWGKVLNIEKVSINDEFFMIGGDSLKALKIVYESELKNIKLSVNDIFKYKTIERIDKNLLDKMKSDKMKSDKMEKGNNFMSEETKENREIPNVIEIEDRWPLSRTYQKNTPFAKELKIEIQRDITVYMHRCLPLCIILADDNIKPWFYEHYINLFSIINLDNHVCVDYHEVWAPYREIINEISLGAVMMEKEKDIINFIVEKINLGYYMNIAVDEYYLPGKSRYGKTHFIHFALIYGYDNMKGEVKAVGYGDGNILSALSFDYNSFTKAYEKGKEYYKDSAPWASRTAVQLFFSNGFEGRYPFNTQKVLKQLKHYLNSVGDDSLLYLWSMKYERAVYGIEVYDLVIESLEGFFSDKCKIDYVTVHLLAEHKKVIAERLKYVIDLYQLNGRILEVFSEFCNLTEMFNEIRLKAFDLEYSFKNNILEKTRSELGTILSETIERLKYLRDKEKNLLYEICELLEEKFEDNELY